MPLKVILKSYWCIITHYDIVLLKNLRPRGLNLGTVQTSTNKPSSWRAKVTKERIQCIVFLTNIIHLKFYQPFNIQFHPSQFSTSIHLLHTICSGQTNYAFKIRWWSWQYFCSSILWVYFLIYWVVQRTTMSQSAKLQRQPGVRKFYHGGTLNAGGTGQLLLLHCSAAVKSARQKRSKSKKAF